MRQVKIAEIIANTGAYFALRENTVVYFSFVSNHAQHRFIPVAQKLVRGDPIDVLSGQVVEQRTDFTLGQTLPLVFTRTWARHTEQSHGLCGQYWVDNFSVYAEISHQGQQIKIATQEGTYLRFGLPLGALQSVNPDYPQFTLNRHRDVLELYDRETERSQYFRIHTPAFDVYDDHLGYPPLEDGRFVLSSWQDCFQNRVTFHYHTEAGQPRLQRITHSDGIQLTLTYRGQWLYQIIRTDNVQAQVLATYQQDSNGSLSESDAVHDFHLFYQYDNHFNLTAWGDRDKTWVNYEYDAQQRCIHSIGAEGFYPVWFKYGENRTTVYDSRQRATVYEYDPHLMLPLSITLPTGACTQFKYDPYGHLLSQTFPDGSQVQFDYLEQTGLVTTFTDSLGYQWHYVYNEQEQLVKITDPLERQWQRQILDFSDNQANHTDIFTAPDGSTTTFIRNAFGLLTALEINQAEQQQHTTFHYDLRHRLIESLDPEQRRLQFQYNHQDSLTGFTSPKGTTWRYRYTAQGKISDIQRPNQSEEVYHYDRHGNLLTYQDPNGVNWTYRYGAFDLLREKQDGEGNRWYYDYDKDSLALSRVTNPKGEHYSYTFNALGLIECETDFTGVQWHYVYNENGHLSQLTNSLGEVCDYRYNANQQLIQIQTPSQVCDYDYDSVGRVTAIVTPHSKLYFAYDSQDRIIEERHDDGEQVFILKREYPDALTQRRHLSVIHKEAESQPLSQSQQLPQPLTTTYRYNKVGELLELTLPQDTSGKQPRLFYQYDVNGNEIQRHSSQGFVYCQQYDVMDNLVRQRAGNEPRHFFESEALRATGIDAPSFAKLDKGYRYDNAQQTISTQQRQEQLRFNVNRNGQITEVWENQQRREHYQYDENGYLTQRHIGLLTAPFTREYYPQPQIITQGNIYQKGNQLARLQETHYEYDKAGRLIARTRNAQYRTEQHETFVWNELNQLVYFTDKYHTQWYYRYDGLGRRIEKRCPAQQWCVKYHWDGDQLAYTQTFKQGKEIAQRHSVFRGWELVAQQDNLNQSQNEDQHQNGNREPLFQTHFVVSEPNGKVQGLFSPEGELAWQAEPQSLWGIYLNVVHHHRPIHPLDPQMLFAGQWRDNESGLAYNRFRYYDPESGNYLSLDPIGLQGGETPYRYVGNPLDWVDLWGLTSCKLARAMEASGIARPRNSAAHHIVPLTDCAAQDARKILARHNIDINSTVNGVFLPNRKNTDMLPGILHNGRHPQEYVRTVNHLIIDADQRGGKQAVLNELNKLRTILVNAPRNTDWRKVIT